MADNQYAPAADKAVRRYVNGFQAGVLFGILLLFLSIIEPAVYAPTAALFVVIGSLVCLSAQRRLRGIVPNSTLRISIEFGALIIVTVLHFTPVDIYRLVVESPVAHAATFSWIYTAVLYFNFQYLYQRYRRIKLVTTALILFIAVPFTVAVLSNL